MALLSFIWLSSSLLLVEGLSSARAESSWSHLSQKAGSSQSEQSDLKCLLTGAMAQPVRDMVFYVKPR